MKAHYIFKAELWVYSGHAAWHFVTLPKQHAGEVRKIAGGLRNGFGSVKVRASIGSTEWLTSIFPDKNSGSYLLPVKKEVRTANNLQAGNNIQVELAIVDYL